MGCASSAPRVGPPVGADGLPTEEADEFRPRKRSFLEPEFIRSRAPSELLGFNRSRQSSGNLERAVQPQPRSRPAAGCGRSGTRAPSSTRSGERTASLRARTAASASRTRPSRRRSPSRASARSRSAARSPAPRSRTRTAASSRTRWAATRSRRYSLSSTATVRARAIRSHSRDEKVRARASGTRPGSSRGGNFRCSRTPAKRLSRLPSCSIETKNASAPTPRRRTLPHRRSGGSPAE